MNKLFSALIVLAVLSCSSGKSPDKQSKDPLNKWISIFDGKTFNGWTFSKENPETFTIVDGMLKVHGKRAHLFYSGSVGNHNFKNFEFKALVKTLPSANSGMFIHTEFQDASWPLKGYEIQVNQTHGDPIKTGSVYGIKNVGETFVKDNEWYTEHIIVQGKKITVKVNDKVINEYIEPENPLREKGDERRLLSSGTVALQGHDPKSVVYYKDIMVKILPD
jgi:hypothetical protein